MFMGVVILRDGIDMEIKQLNEIEKCPQCKQNCKLIDSSVYVHVDKPLDCSIVAWSYYPNAQS